MFCFGTFKLEQARTNTSGVELWRRGDIVEACGGSTSNQEFRAPRHQQGRTPEDRWSTRLVRRAAADIGELPLKSQSQDL